MVDKFFWDSILLQCDDRSRAQVFEGCVVISILDEFVITQVMTNVAIPTFVDIM